MSVDGDAVVPNGGGSEGFVLEAVNLVTDVSNAWARLTVAASSTWCDETPPIESRSLMWWLPPCGLAFDDGDESLLRLKIFRQPVVGNDSGFLIPVEILIHWETGAARVEGVGGRLPGFEPGLMVPLPRCLCVMFDWLMFGYEARTTRRDLWEDGQVDGVNDNGFVVDSGRFLRFLTFNRSESSVRSFGRFFGVAEVAEEVPNHVAEAELPVAMVLAGEDERTVRIGNQGSVGSSLGKIHRAALTNTLDSGSSSSSSWSDDDSEIEVISISS